MSIEILSILKKNVIMKFRSANSIVGGLHLVRTLKILVQHDLFFSFIFNAQIYFSWVLTYILYCEDGNPLYLPSLMLVICHSSSGRGINAFIH